MKTIFITGTGTNVGKTYAVSSLIRVLRAHGRTVSALKPIISGYNQDQIAESDCGEILSALDERPTPENVQCISPWRFSDPISPDMAAAREQRKIGFRELLNWTLQPSLETDFRLIEGVGGILVPLSPEYTVLDWMVAINYPILLVGGSYLGSINHALMSLRVLIQAGLKIEVLVISESDDAPVSLPETISTIQNFCSECPVFGLPRNSDMSAIASALGWIAPSSMGLEN